ncbi:RNA-directed DNA polymerase (Reverse transcriptase) [Thiorhodococcus drewsii AZ1]|uniref:RNA-directed DNA polymerase (Reverse transcriptase) n=1 Tax=Thiorhodococcus drewsii AZ1 TaxID=765913 RepID=G2DYQ3_9GAMM|nr:reverse transcriptase domain-containing protein [Thiorhodococcus drewsii]EGV32680.1 RNA-directed DNA polymerase (Reverse transcriptase) [Thiorhodococcus drewsii AZ1]
MLSLRSTLCQSDNLGLAFDRYRRYRGFWSPGVTMYSVARSPVVPMLELAEELRAGRYHPTPPQVISIAKANGERRELRVFAIRDRVAQRALLQVLQRHTDPAMSPFSYGYRPGRSVQGALARVRTFLSSGLSWVVDADIQRCFDSIPRQPLLDEVIRRWGRTEAADLVAEWLGWDTAAQRDGIGIPQGSVLAPWLCNVYLWRLDDAMRQVHGAMVRFADDFVLLSTSRSGAEALLRRCAAVVEGMQLHLHPLKTSILDASKPFRFLGQWLSVPRLLTQGAAQAGGSLL